MLTGQKIKELRLYNNFSQEELAQKANISRSVISQYEHAIIEPTASVVARLAVALGCSSDYLLDLENDYGAKTVAPMGDNYSPEERQLIEEYRKLPTDSKKLVLRMVGVTSTPQGAKKKA